MAEERRRVCVFGLGGTIAMTAGSDGRAAPGLSPRQLLDGVPGLADTGVDLEVTELRRLPGPALGPADLAELAQRVAERWEQGVDGVVVVQGTDTIEESAYLLDLWHTGPQPIVVTGAMRIPEDAGADGPANLLAAVRVAAAEAAEGEGALVVMGDEIHAARRVRKTHTTRPAAFTSPDGGPLGVVAEGLPHFFNRLQRRVAVPAPPNGPAGPWPRVGLATIALGDDGALLHGAADRLDGLVVAGLGGGHVPPDLVPTLGELAGSIPVVLASRVAGGAVLTSSYGYPGSEQDLLRHGLVGAGFLDPVKSRILLLALLAAQADATAIRTAFEAIGGHASAGDTPT